MAPTRAIQELVHDQKIRGEEGAAEIIKRVDSKKTKNKKKIKKVGGEGLFNQ